MGGRGSGRDDDVLRADVLGAAGTCDPNRIDVDKASQTLEDLDLAFLHQKHDALRHLVDHALLVGMDAIDVERRAGNVDADARGFLDLVEELGGVKKGFGRDAAAMQAGPAEEGVLFDQSRLETENTGADRSDVTARTAADNDDIELFHARTPCCGNLRPRCTGWRTRRSR